MKPYEECTVAELQDLLRARDLPVSGTKPELIARLEAADEAASRDDAAAIVSAVVTEPEQPAATQRHPGECVVDDGTPHMGRAVPGTLVCSRHANRYRNDGTRRVEPGAVQAA